MKRKVVSACTAILLAVVISTHLSAQSSRLKSTAARTRSTTKAAAPNQVLRIDKIYGVGNRAKIQTPIFSTSIPRGSSSGQIWAKIEVLYETARSDEEWLDELTFQYYALAKRVDKKTGPQYTFYRKNVHYVDIEVATRPLMHKSTVFLRPSTIKKYGELVAVAVEINYKGVTVDKAMEIAPGASLPSGEWWKNTAITENKITTVKDGYLLDRAKSPFALINIDDYEVIK